MINIMTTESPEKKVQRYAQPFNDDKSLRGIAQENVSNELEALSYSISHDLRAPLRAIRSNCEWLNARHTESLSAPEFSILKQIAESSELMEKLLDGLLAFSKVVKTDPQINVIDMTALAKKVMNELLLTQEEPSAFTVVLPPLLPSFGDPILIRQVWCNLLSNAVKYTQYRNVREIEISSTQCDGEVVYCVRDNGAGFNMEYSGLLFGVFRRLHAVEEFHGTGVGLAIVKRIIQRHGGRVWAEGKEDFGARFYFTLPSTENK